MFSLLYCLSPLVLGLRVNEVAEALDLRQIKFARVEGASRELARLGGAKAFKGSQRAHNGINDCDAAVNLHHA